MSHLNSPKQAAIPVRAVCLSQPPTSCAEIALRTKYVDLISSSPLPPHFHLINLN